ncbi:unnamed protein product [Heligmosomoides polygyrus]|uniref:Uncharacterized protein n=1 Tax=Heligmosomoides polygyrus TaxID=6339 RepID=A0A183GJE7_HELPZ|nr:unnamed protein product [Heligmosomoides polygyrus]
MEIYENATQWQKFKNVTYLGNRTPDVKITKQHLYHCAIQATGRVPCTAVVSSTLWTPNHYTLLLVCPKDSAKTKHALYCYYYLEDGDSSYSIRSCRSGVPFRQFPYKTALLYKKGDMHDIGNCCSICLLSVVYKLFTQVILNRINRTNRDAAGAHLSKSIINGTIGDTCDMSSK